MNQADYINNHFDLMIQFGEALHWLKRSYGICKEIGVKEEYEEAEFDSFETLTGRFARISDMIIQKIFRSIDKIEFEQDGTLLDAINRAHKRELIDSIDEIREIRELRNDIVHEYAPVELKDLFEDALKYSELLFAIADRVKKYSEKFKKGN